MFRSWLVARAGHYGVETVRDASCRSASLPCMACDGRPCGIPLELRFVSVLLFAFYVLCKAAACVQAFVVWEV